ncbi:MULTISPECIES: cobyric acid synthase [Leptospira]|uniref:Cobyric acid synthase n=1 Tax=Leptospira borgpetersenii str. Brem 328 TaxID=1049780 RepID=A0ABC9SFT2_LEPBO|nr:MULTISPECIES: cobyric acid synthase [Leptospira]EMK13798.1 cobyric acid synthase CobQ [Leptospira sp. serovar Kenya str. Sh9]EMN12937.1 cobyric acid synthase CobQ [Leptospira borgpetersenii str. Brem 307]EMN16592.1 cobyric acid synthase CobQ [Leptospira borgpetersenii str. Brem 328]URD71564.1 cobyric acid synthase [Leptospira borgpetersenii]UVD74766.1 cobyric acid synthase [Leptospira borgpetersenii]
MNQSGHGGNLIELAQKARCKPNEILDFSVNVNPLGFPEWLRPFINSKISDLVSYPDPNYTSLKETIHSKYKIPKEQIVLGNGASELILQIPFVANTDYALIATPCYSGYKEGVSLKDIPCTEIVLKEKNFFRLDFDEVRNILKSKSDQKALVFLGHPNNPTGITLNRSETLKLVSEFSSYIFVIDESFIDLCPKGTSFLNDRTNNMILIRSMTKVLAIPGLRIGVCFASPQICSSLSKRLPTWNVNTLAASVYEKAITEDEYTEKSKQKVLSWKEKLEFDLSNLEFLHIFPSDTNFILIKILKDRSATELTQELLQKYRIAVRDCGNFSGLSENFIRIAVRTPEENEKIINAFSDIFYSTNKIHKIPKKATPAIMLQGTASNVGKSILTAALCRILAQEGVKVAPFKSQNMALNSFVTSNGREIGRAQALQAQAAKIPPDIRMNPILLKPSSEKDSQVIVNGIPVGAMSFKDYTEYKSIAFEEVKKSYDSLSSEYNVIIIEGAGSASEVNLKKNDLVNMRMAEYAKAKVLLVGNIDHGGIFGSILGTMETLVEWERKLVFGFIINRFRGAKEFLKTGTEYIEEYTGKPVLGIVPHLQNLGLPEEDSLEFKSGALDDTSKSEGRIDIALIDIPRISNHTDIDALKSEPDVRVRIVRTCKDLGEPDIVILPGSKNVITDLDHLRDVGLADRIITLAQNQKTDIVGICGGYQMLGRNIFDPYKIETDRKSAKGLSLLQIESTLEKDKSLKQTIATHIPTGCEIEGYEIHHGKTTSTGENTRVIFLSGKTEELGHSDLTGRIWGTYIHGVFDKDEFRRKYLDQIRIRKGKPPLINIQFSYDLEKSLNRLAEHVRLSLNMDLIYQTLGLG